MRQQQCIGIITDPGKEEFREAIRLLFYFPAAGILPDELFLRLFVQVAAPTIAPAGKATGRGAYLAALIIIQDVEAVATGRSYIIIALITHFPFPYFGWRVLQRFVLQGFNHCRHTRGQIVSYLFFTKAGNC